MIEREFYPLPLAAEKMGCTVDDLLHLGARGRLGIYFLPAGLQLIAEKFADGELTEKHIDDAITEPQKLSRRSIELLEAGNNDALVELDYDHDTTHKVRRFAPVSNPAEHDLKAMFDDPVAYAKKVRTDYQGVKISDVRLVVKHDELMNIAGNSTKPKTNANKSNLLATLNQASERFWINADRSDKTTWPNNDTVAAWLKDRGFSSRLASSGASIIRPDIMAALIDLDILKNPLYLETFNALL